MNHVKVTVHDENGNIIGVQAMDKHQWSIIASNSKQFKKLQKRYVEDLPYDPEPGDVLSPEKTGGSELAAYKRSHETTFLKPGEGMLSRLESHPDYAEFMQFRDMKKKAFDDAKAEGFPGDYENFTPENIYAWNMARIDQQQTATNLGGIKEKLSTEEIDKKFNKQELMVALTDENIAFDVKQTKAELVDIYFINQK